MSTDERLAQRKPACLPPASELRDQVRQVVQPALLQLEGWIEHEGFRGWDPHDALNSRLLRRISLGNRLVGIAFLQLFKCSPINLRPLFLVEKDFNPKGMGLFLASYVRRYRATGSGEYLNRVRFFADWLRDHVSPGYHGACWGYNFDWPNRGFDAPAGTPTVVNTAFIALAFLDAYRYLGGQELKAAGFPNASPLLTARSACDFVLRDLNILQGAEGEICFSYTPLDRRAVHNASMMAAWLLAAVYAQTGEAELAEKAVAAARYTARRQNPNGSWPYGSAGRDYWVDNLHTAFVLSALRGVALATGTAEFQDTLARGYEFWNSRMFLGDGTPRYYAGRTYPVDTHSVAQAVLTFLDFAYLDTQAVKVAVRVARWGIENMQDSAGFFHYQIHRSYRIRIPYMRWAQAWMHRALSELAFQVPGDHGSH